jgi:hypothetical protein
VCFAESATLASCKCSYGWSGDDCGSCPAGADCGPGGSFGAPPAAPGSGPAGGAGASQAAAFDGPAGARVGAAALTAQQKWDLLIRVLTRLCDGDMGFTYVKQGKRGLGVDGVSGGWVGAVCCLLSAVCCRLLNGVCVGPSPKHTP